MAGGAPGERIIATGRVEQHADYGAQFKVEACRFEVPETADEVLRQMSKLSPKAAEAIAAALGSAADQDDPAT